MSKAILIPTISKGGAEKVAYNLWKAGLFDYIIVFDGRINAYGIPEKFIINLELPSSVFFLRKVVIMFRRLAKLYNIKKKYRFDLILSLLEPANLCNILTSDDEKIILSFRNYYKKDFDYNLSLGVNIQRTIAIILYKLALKYIYNHADLLVTVSNCAKIDLVESFGLDKNKLVVMYNPVYINEIEKQKLEDVEELNQNIYGKFIITVGRLTKQKGQWYLLRIFREIKKEFPELKLVILGDGELKEYLTSISKKLGFKTYVWDIDQTSDEFDVYFLGFQSNPFKFIARAKLYVFPSLWEGFPNALLEAMACGMPVVSSDCRSGPREILAPNTDCTYETKVPEFAEYGILMPVFDVKFKDAEDPLDEIEKKWVETLIKILKNEDLLKKYSLKAQNRSKEFNIEKISEQWQKLIENLVNKRK